MMHIVLDNKDAEDILRGVSTKLGIPPSEVVAIALVNMGSVAKIAQLVSEATLRDTIQNTMREVVNEPEGEQET